MPRSKKKSGEIIGTFNSEAIAMKGSALVFVGLALGCAAGAVGLVPSRSIGQTSGNSSAVAQYCTDTGDFNDTAALDGVVRRAGSEGWELIGVYRPTGIGATHVDYVCFRRPR
jgi:hypothetical protein